jgi:LmbE family N-acetylglucosaminyl deacetylase/regulation of enolase protein 1 (concanavalin A-like superfamily)
MLLGAVIALLLAPAAAGAQGTTIVADEFQGTSLNTAVWTFANPVGDASVSVGGGHATVSLPAGTVHDVWGNNNSSTGLRQEVPNRDFEVEAKFDTAVSSGFQMQGIIVEQDANDLVRAEVHHDGAGTRLFVATIAGGNSEVRHYSTVPGGAPAYVRVVREGNSWRVRYSRDGQSWTTTEPFTFAMTVNRMGPLVGNSSGPSFAGQIDSFREVLPDTTAPAISAIGSAPRTIDATVTWTTDEASTSEVSYGLTTSYGSASVANAGLTTDHSVVVHGLACGTTYHFQVQSKDASNNTATGPDRTLTTAACPPMTQSDEFNGASIDMNRWSLVNPVGGVSLSAVGGQALFDLSAGVQHDIWTGSDSLPRLMQFAPNDNFEMTAKFDSAVSLAYQMQGLVVQQDANDLLRLEVHFDGADTNLFAASFVNGSASVVGDILVVPDGSPVYLRVRRTGDQWTFSYSSNGTAWTRSTSFTRAMTVTAVGLLAGNSGVFAPAYEARVDWFHYTPPDRTAPVISNPSVTATPGAGSTARITWTTDEIASSEVSYGETTAYANGSVSGPGDTANHAVVLHGLKCNTTYHYRVRSVDPSSNASNGVDRTFTSASCPTLMTSDEFNAATLDTAKWAFIDPLGDSSNSMAAGATQLAVPADQAHDLWANVNSVPRLLQAAPNTDFEVVVKFNTGVTVATQQQGIVVEESANKLLRFETYYDGTSPKLFVAAIDGGTADVIHQSTVPAGAPVYLKLRRVGDTWTFSYSNDGEGWRSTAFSRTLAVTAVGPYVGNGGTKPAFQGQVDYFREITDRTPPEISQIASRPVSRQAQVTWTTDELASSVVEFRQGAGAWQSRSGTEALETRHTVSVTGLACSSNYTIRIKSADAGGNLATSSESLLTTSACTPTGGPDVDVWNGDTQTFGEQGVPQTWVNVNGSVSDPDGLQSITGALNSGGRETLGTTPDGWRTARPGEFNYEINVSELLPGPNFVELRATDNLGNVTTRTVTLNWAGYGETSSAPANGPVLIVAAHPDDESLGMAGIIERARVAGRRVVVALVTNGEGGTVDGALGDCGAPNDAAPAARYGLMRDQEARDAMTVLGLTRTSNLNTTGVIYLGYPGGRITDIAQTDVPISNSSTGIQRTYAEDFDASVATCNGDFRYLLSGTHSQFNAAALQADLNSLMALIAPSDIYTHAFFDGHPDHAEIGKQMMSAVRRANVPVRVHTTFQHPYGDGNCMELSSARWPNPALANNNPFARFTPTLDFTAPPAFPCDPGQTLTSWGPMGAPNEIVDVPANMQTTSEATNKKWLTIDTYDSQIDCENPDPYHVNCGYMRAFVKKSEFFWRYEFNGKRVWSRPYTTNWTSNASIAHQAQILEGQWRYDNGGVRPLTTGFDRALLIGDTGWINYDVKAPITIHSFDPTTGQGAAVGLALGWQGHTGWGQPRHGHPGGGLCLYARAGSDPDPFKLQLGYSPGPVDDTTLASKDMSLAYGTTYMFRFRQQGVSAGLTRYSCKVWRADQAEPAAWDLTADIPDWPGTTGQRSGSAVLLAHETDSTFGNATVTSLGG